jgi:transcriptional regulator with XRE-family HTH domain
MEKRNPLGATGETVRANVKRLREERSLGYAELSRRLKSAGRSIPELGLRRIEEGARRVDADDLMGLADALGVSPIGLLMPQTDAGDEVVHATSYSSGPAHRLWDRLRAAPFRDGDGAMNYRVCLDSTPPWAIADLGITVAMVDFNREADRGND